jgi:hypothetical protein
MGEHDSSLTRVQPCFTSLALRSHPWIEDLLALGSRSKAVGLPTSPGWAGAPAAHRGHNGRQQPHWAAFEYACPAPVDYLLWLLENIVQEGRQPKLFTSKDPTTKAMRAALLARDPAVVADAKKLLSAKGGNSGSKWHIFEGATMVDCALFFEGVTVFIEGKRTESNLTTGTKWHERRKQVVRNLDCLRAEPGRAERWYVLTVIEKGKTTLLADAEALDGDRQSFVDALPHLSPPEVDEVRSHYLGWTTWQEIKKTFKLPRYPDTAVVTR